MKKILTDLIILSIMRKQKEILIMVDSAKDNILNWLTNGNL